jgi:DNA replication protein DnaD
MVISHFEYLFSFFDRDLSNNELSWTIEDMNGTFYELNNLQSLSLENNKIKSIANNAFMCFMPTLQYFRYIVTRVRTNFLYNPSSKKGCTTPKVSCQAKMKYYCTAYKVA